MAPSSDPRNVLISTGRQMHYRLPANALVRRGFGVTLNSSTPPSRLRGFDPAVRQRFTPAPVNLLQGLTRTHVPQWASDRDSAIFDRLSAIRAAGVDLLLGAASSSLLTGRAVRRRGGRFVLDRACPHIQFQQDMVAEEARKLGGTFTRSAPWFIERQIAEYEESDTILLPSNYSRNSFPEHLRNKGIVAPLLGRAPAATQRPIKRSDEPFTVGVVGGSPLRKGYVYLLEAWKQLALPNARLLLRSGGELEQYPRLAQLLHDLSNVEIVGYVPNLSDFYHRCDAFVLPSVDDGFGMALFEAAAHGLPCIATRNCGASELLEPEHDALIVDAFSSEQLAAALERLYRDPDLRERLAESGAGKVASFHRDGVALPYEEGLDRLFDFLAHN
jgi:glycosyltransferase involved in cell wall biosynthesis